ncbi:MAG TPA: acetate--CoA ligase family protein [Solirubrobacteraceae bacterium]|nr:acetate--CoA ligase family protein [Solirubrobacteraceae bacterium]
MLSRLLSPRSVAVVGASDRAGSYAAETLLNLERLGFEGDVWGVNPGRSSALGVPCFRSLSELPAVPDAVVVAIPAAGVAAVIEEAGALGCGGAVVYAAGFGETRAGVSLEVGLREAALRHGLPVCGPNCDGLIALHSRAALWGDALASPQPGHVALVSQSGNLVVNALATRRGLRLHTAVSSGNETVVTTPDWVEHLAREPGVRSIALLVEADGDGSRLCEALAVCADEGVGVAVLKVGASAVGAAAAAAHTGALAGDHRVFRALMEEAGAAWADDVHDLLEKAKALAVRRPGARRDGLAILTCSGGDSGLGADEAARRGLSLPGFAPATVSALRERLPEAATVANPLDYTALIWGETDTLRDIVREVGGDPEVGQVLVFYDRPAGIDGAAAESWDAVEAGILAGAAVSPVPVMVSSTLPELLDDEAAWRFQSAGVAAVAGLRTGVACAGLRALDGPRLREIAGVRVARGTGRWLAEHEAKALLRRCGVPVVGGRLALSEGEARAALADLGGAVAVKLSSPDVRHKSAVGALALDLRDPDEVGAAWSRIATLSSPNVLVEEMAPPGVELIVSVRSDAVVPALIVGLGGAWTEALDDIAIIPLPAGVARVTMALTSLRGAALLDGLDAAPIAVAIAEAALTHGLELLECNPVIVHPDGAVVVDAVAQEVAP